MGYPLPTSYSYTPPQVDNLLCWFKVNEGSGGIIVNSAHGKLAIPNMTFAVQNADFWTHNVGFGYFDGSTTDLTVTLPSTNPFSGPCSSLVFCHSDCTTGDSTYRWVYEIGAGFAPRQYWYQSALNQLWIRSGWSSGPSTKVIKANISAWAGLNCCVATRIEKYINGTTKEWARFTTDSDWVTVTSAASDKGSTNPLSLVTIGYAHGGGSIQHFKGVIGDFMAWNVQLTDDEVNSVFNALKGRWGF